MFHTNTFWGICVCACSASINNRWLWEREKERCVFVGIKADLYQALLPQRLLVTVGDTPHALQECVPVPYRSWHNYKLGWLPTSPSYWKVQYRSRFFVVRNGWKFVFMLKKYNHLCTCMHYFILFFIVIVYKSRKGFVVICMLFFVSLHVALIYLVSFRFEVSIIVRLVSTHYCVYSQFCIIYSLFYLQSAIILFRYIW